MTTASVKDRLKAVERVLTQNVGVIETNTVLRDAVRRVVLDPEQGACGYGGTTLRKRRTSCSPRGTWTGRRCGRRSRPCTHYSPLRTPLRRL
jgi:hypothetical protein